MAKANPNVQQRNQYGRDWGNYPSLDVCPNAASWAGGSNPAEPLEIGDRAYIDSGNTIGPCHCVSAGTPGLLDAVWEMDRPSGIERVEIDFGTTPQWQMMFTVSNFSVTPLSRIVAWESAETATGRVGVDQEWDQLLLAARPDPITPLLINIYATAFPGPVVGRRVIYYQIGD